METNLGGKFIPMPFLCDGLFGCDCPAVMKQIEADRRRARYYPPRKHGTATMYNNGKCRCNVCKQHMAKRMREYRARKNSKGEK